MWSLYAPGFMANYNVNEGRDVEVSWAGFFAFWVLVPCAVVGGVHAPPSTRADHTAGRRSS